MGITEQIQRGLEQSAKIRAGLEQSRRIMHDYNDSREAREEAAYVQWVERYCPEGLDSDEVSRPWEQYKSEQEES